MARTTSVLGLWVVLPAVLIACSCGKSKSKSESQSTSESHSQSAPSTELTEKERSRIPGVIAFVSERGANKDVWLAWPNGKERQLTSGIEDEFPAAATADGSAVAVVATREIDGFHREQIRVVKVADGSAKALEAPRGRARNPTWAPDGSWLVAESDAQAFSDLVRLKPDASAEPVRLATAPAGNFEPRVSPDGKHIAFVSSRDGDPEIYVMNADGGDVRRLTAFHREDWAPQWSPDGAWIAFYSTREGRPRVFLVRPDGTDTRSLSGEAATGEERDAAWSPDGKRIAFVGRQADGITRIWVATTTGEPPVALTDGKHRDDQPAWSPDGKYLVFASERGGDTNLFLMRADGSGQTELTKATGADWLPRWLNAQLKE